MQNNTSELLFDGLKVLDFTWVGVGPITTKYFADHGADVIKIESVSRPDVLRGAPPFKDAIPGINRSQFSGNYNSSKRNLGVNLSIPKSVDLIKNIIAQWQPDVIAESFTPRVMKSWGLDYLSVKRIAPDVIYFSTCLMGQYGPHNNYAGFGQLAGAMAGFYEITGWPDRGPAGPYGAYSDFLNPPVAFGSIVAALDYRDRYGKGQHIDLSQYEGAMHFLAPHIMKYNEDGFILGRMGNEDEEMSPHGIFQCLDKERGLTDTEESWVAIAIESESQWTEFSKVLDLPEAISNQNLAERKLNKDQIDNLISNWTLQKDARQIMNLLQSHEIPCGMVQSQSDMWEDPQLKHTDFFQWLEHSEVGPMPYDGLQFTLSKTPGSLTRAQAMVGEHNLEILDEILSIGPSEAADLLNEGILEQSF